MAAAVSLPSGLAFWLAGVFSAAVCFS